MSNKRTQNQWNNLDLFSQRPIAIELPFAYTESTSDNYVSMRPELRHIAKDILPI